MRDLPKAGIDPIERRRQIGDEMRRAAEIPTFEQAGRRVNAKLAAGFRNKKHIDQWINTLEAYVFPKIGGTLVKELGPADFAACLRAIWLEKRETASRIEQRCDSVMEWRAANGHILASPVRVVDKLLPKQPGKCERVSNHPAVPWRRVPSFFKEHLSHGGRGSDDFTAALLPVDDHAVAPKRWRPAFRV